VIDHAAWPLEFVRVNGRHFVVVIQIVKRLVDTGEVLQVSQHYKLVCTKSFGFVDLKPGGLCWHPGKTHES
jgi:hypothetical protein